MIAKRPFLGWAGAWGRRSPCVGVGAGGLGRGADAVCLSSLASAWPGPWELALPSEASLRKLFPLLTKGCSVFRELTLGLNPVPSLAQCLVVPGTCWVRWPEGGAGEVQPFQAEESRPDASGLGAGSRCPRLRPSSALWAEGSSRQFLLLEAFGFTVIRENISAVDHSQGSGPAGTMM